jgi:subtilisin
MGAIVRLPPDIVSTPVFLQQGETVDWSLTLAGVPDLWKITKGKGLKVGVLDSGCDLNHPDLKEAIDVAKDFTGSRFGAQDRNGHGTHVCGTIAARADNNGIIGILPECRLHVYKVLDDQGAGSSDGIAAAFDEAAADGCDLINCSFGAGYPDPLMRAANTRAAQRGLWCICAAGNNGGAAGYPAAWNWNVAVAAYMRNGQPAQFSARGAAVDIGAYGVDIVSCAPGGGHQKMSGTSMASPFVTGIAGLYLARLLLGGATVTKPGVTQLIAKLKEGATDPGQAGTGGLINPGKIIEPIVAPPPGGGEPGRSTLIGQWEGFGVYVPARASDLISFSIGPVDGA